MKKNTTNVGNRAEDLTVKRILERGYTVLDRNVNERFSEIDIIAKHGDTICFIEVRSRFDDQLGHPLETIDFKKQMLVRKAAKSYLVRNGLWDKVAVRFDAATVLWSTNEFTYLENVF